MRYNDNICSERFRREESEDTFDSVLCIFIDGANVILAILGLWNQRFSEAERCVGHECQRVKNKDDLSAPGAWDPQVRAVVFPVVEHLEALDEGRGSAVNDSPERSCPELVPKGPELDVPQRVGVVAAHYLCEGIQPVVKIEDAQFELWYQRGQSPGFAGLGVPHEEEFCEVT